MQVWSKWHSNKRHFTLQADSVSRLYLASHCSGLFGAAYPALSAGAVQAVDVFSKSFSKERNFILEANSAYLLYLASHSSVVTGTANLALCR
jgi:hypothetical protein